VNRRGFLASLAGAATIALDPERALWVPRRKLISVARRRNVLVTPEWYARQVLIALQNDLMLARAVSGDYGSMFNQQHLRIGDTIAVPRPARFRSRA
jgi:hypothetical protein